MREPIDNEPALPIKGGAIRDSRQIDRTELPALAARERVLAVLRAHDPNTRRLAAPALHSSDFPLVRAMAQEGAISNAEPTVRYGAIAALAPSQDGAANLNLLAELAHFGEDFYVRGHALLALGAAGLVISLPTIAAHLTAEDSFERTAARRAVALIAEGTSPETVKAHASLLSESARAEVIRALAERGTVRKHRGEIRTTRSRSDRTDL